MACTDVGDRLWRPDDALVRCPVQTLRRLDAMAAGQGRRPLDDCPQLGLPNVLPRLLRLVVELFALRGPLALLGHRLYPPVRCFDWVGGDDLLTQAFVP